MATDTTRTGPADGAGPPENGRVIQYADYVERQLRKTGRQVKGVDLAANVMLLVVGVLAYLLTAVLVDHWLVAGGLGFGARLALWLIMVAGLTAYLVVRIMPLVVKRINPVYAASVIERSRPSLKNSLINFLLLRGRGQPVAPAIYSAVEQRAAVDLSTVPVEAAVDRSHLIRILWALLALIVFGGLYAVVSPKNPFPSIGRLAAPWADIAPPSRVKISDVRPGEATAFHDQFVEVSADISGLKQGEQATLHYSSLDGQIVDRQVPLRLPSGGYRYTAELPPDTAALQQDLDYWITAGDARSPTYRVTVLVTPTMVVEAAEYKYPDYTGISPRRVERQGDLQAIEGTVVTLHATANQEIRAAYVDFERNGQRDLKMRADKQQAAVSFPLRLKDNRQEAEYSSYQLRFLNADGHENPRPTAHRIEVVRDEAPRIEFVEPTTPPPGEQALPLGSSLPLEIAAADPDFKLAQVTIVVQRNGQTIVSKPLLSEPQSGEVKLAYLLDTAAEKLRADDRVVYWAVAEDNKQPQPGRTQTPRYRLRITAPTEPQQLAQAPQRQQPQAQPDAQPPAEARPQSQPDQQPAPPDAKSDAQQPPAAPQPPSEAERRSGQAEPPAEPEAPPAEPAQDDRRRLDPEANPGEAFEKLNEHFRNEQQQQPRQPEEPAPNEQQRQDAGEQGGQQQAGGQQGPQQQQPGAQQQPGEPNQQSAQQQPGSEQQRGADQQPGEQQPGAAAQQPGEPDQAGIQKEPGRQQNGQQQPGAQQQRSADQQPGGQQQAGAQDQAGPQQQGAAEQQRDGQGQPDAQQQPGGQQPSGGRQQPGAQQSGGQQQPAGQQQAGGQQPTDGQQQPADQQAGAGAQPQGDSSGKSDDQASSQSQSSDTQRAQGSPGQGQPPADESAPPAPQEEARPRDKQSGSPSDDPLRQQQEGSSPGINKEQSDSRGDTSGDRSGGGQQGGGQRSDQQGTGAAGENTAADEGGGRSAESGHGEPSDRPGDKQRGPGGGQPDGSPAPGGQRQAAGGSQTGGDADTAGKPSEAGGEQPDADRPQPGQPPREPQTAGPQPGQPSGDASPGRAPQANPTAGGQPGDTTAGEPLEGDPARRGGGYHVQFGDTTAGKPLEEPNLTGGDDPNLEYARKAVDLVIERLKDQLAKDQLDPKLLEQMQWSREDVERFVKRWQAMRDAAAAQGHEGQAAQQQLDDAIRNLGLRPRGTSLSSGQVSGDTARDLRETRRTAPPPEYADQYRAYTTGTSKAREQ